MSPPDVSGSSTPRVDEGLDITALTKRLIAGEDAAWEETHRRYAPRLFRYLIVAAHGDETAAGDALQAAFVRAVRYARVWHSEEALWGWLTLMARHALADARRTTGRWRAFLARFALTIEPPGPPAEPDPLPAHLEHALATLTEDDRALLQARYFDNTSIRTLSAAAGTTEKALESRLTRARVRLRENLLALLHP